MKHVRLLGLALVAVFALSAVAVGVASAESPEITTTLPAKFTSKGGVSKLVSAAGTIGCLKLRNTGEFTTARTGTLTIDFEECTSSGVACKSTGDMSGTILVTGSTHLVGLKPASTLGLGVAVTPSPTVVIKCGTLAIEVLGTVIGQVEGVASTVEVPAGTAKSLVFAESAGVQAIKKCEVDKAFCEGKSYELLAEFGTGYKPAIEVTTDEITFEKGIKITF